MGIKIALAVFGFTLLAVAGPLSFPSPVFVAGSAVASGPSFALPGGAVGADTLSLTASGTACLQDGPAYCTNAAGVILVAGTSGVGEAELNGSQNFGALLLGNSTVGFVQLFAANPAAGLGSAAPPDTLSITGVTLASLGFPDLAPGTVLEWRVSDTFDSDNSGGYTVTGSPEAVTSLLVGVGLVTMGVLRRRRHKRR